MIARKTVSAGLALAILASTAVAFPAPAHADGAGAALGIIGGILALSAVAAAASQPQYPAYYYAAPPQYYYPPQYYVPAPQCKYWSDPYWDGYRWRRQYLGRGPC